ncbi:hypothetical protein M404DRAFT_34478 [Pisolithus tinctorius Marx 270]|uniref:CCHC-type domain-containing protein n=1 Tax=Pisolithus tinctorius Marx 270 TaxID=870435 RepID=A0A0C3IDG0_PISTI|nr:hypothetical protein M404DRAFT_34478 [Pisolithus tinctorius Marx 270]
MAMLPPTLTLLQPVELATRQGFSAWTSNTPTPCCPTAPIPEDDPSNDGLGNDDDNNPDDDDPGNSPGDDGPSEDNPEDEPDFPDLDTEPTIMVLDNLAEAIKLLAHNAHTSESSSRTKLHEPDTFDGTDPKKLCAFFIQCKLNFQDQPQAFRTNCAKVIFMQSYLKGMALEWFEPDLLGLNDPDDWPLWMDSWREFVLELQTTFSPHDLVTDAKIQGYRDGVLHHHFYSGLPDWIKDEVCRVGKPWTLCELCHLAQEIDVCYWECKEEIQWAGRHQGLSTSNNKSSGPGSNSQDKAKTGSNNNTGSTQSKLASSKAGNNSNSSKPEPSKLRKDGKLTPEECKHCIEGNLCMFCGGPGHFAEKCPKKIRKAKAHAVATSEAAPVSVLGSSPKTKK